MGNWIGGSSHNPQLVEFELPIILDKQPWGNVLIAHVLTGDNRCDLTSSVWFELGKTQPSNEKATYYNTYFMTQVKRTANDEDWEPVGRSFYFHSCFVVDGRIFLNFGTPEDGMTMQYAQSGIRFYDIVKHGKSIATYHSHPIGSKKAVNRHTWTPKDSSAKEMDDN